MSLMLSLSSSTKNFIEFEYKEHLNVKLLFNNVNYLRAIKPELYDMSGINIVSGFYVYQLSPRMTFYRILLFDIHFYIYQIIVRIYFYL